MENAREKLRQLIDEMTDHDLAEILDFVQFIKIKREDNSLVYLQQASESSLEFWDNPIDDEVWNDV